MKRFEKKCCYGCGIMNYFFLGVKITSKSLRVHSATSSLSLTKISVPTSTDPHILLAGVVPGSYNNNKQKMKINHIK